MKVLHINTNQTGGAAWCAIRINKALVREGVDSCMLFAEGNTVPEGVEGAIATRDKEFWYTNQLLGKVKHLLMRTQCFNDAEKWNIILKEANNGLSKKQYLHHPYSYYKNIAHHPLVEWADIVHLHWVPNFVDYPSFFKQIKKPIVWTLHDKYPAVGVLHYSSKFHPVPDELKSLDLQCRKTKRKGVSKARSLNLVAISDLMAEECKNSDVLGGFPVTLIHNGVDTTIFQPHDKLESRTELGLIADAKIFLFSSYVISDFNKGIDRVIGALEEVDVPNKLLICIGNIPFNESPIASFPIIVTGVLKNQSMIAKYYSAADFFIQSSYEESFGQTVLESMACGTPVISTPCGVAPEVIYPFNGVICNDYDSESIAAGIKEAMNKQYDAGEIRQYIIDNYQYDKISKQYVELYKTLI